jgi:phosphate transport system protein
VVNQLLEARLEALRDSLDKLSATVDENLRAVLLRLTCDKTVTESSPLVSIEEHARTARERCLLLVAREHPMAGDLKYAMAALRVGQDYERIHDLALALNRRIDKLTGTSIQEVVQDMTGVMADILKMHEHVRQTWQRDRKGNMPDMMPQISGLYVTVQSRITEIQTKIMEAISRGGGDAEMYVEVVLACRHLKRIAQTMESIPDELRAFDRASGQE